MHSDAGDAGAGPAEAVGKVDGHVVVVAVEVRGVGGRGLGGGSNSGIERSQRMGHGECCSFVSEKESVGHSTDFCAGKLVMLRTQMGHQSRLSDVSDDLV